MTLTLSDQRDILYIHNVYTQEVLMTTTSIRKWGNSQGLYIPKDMLRQLGIAVNSKVLLELVDGTIVIRKADLASSKKKAAFKSLQEIRRDVMAQRNDGTSADKDGAYSDNVDYREKYMEYLDDRYGEHARQEDD